MESEKSMYQVNFSLYNQPRNVLTEGRLSLFVGAMMAAFFVSVCVSCADNFHRVQPLKHLKTQPNRQVQAAIDLKSCLYYIEICAFS